MKRIALRGLLLGLSLLPALCSAQAHPLSPMYSKVRMIAGAGDAGFRDGNFVQAAFNGPRGLAVSVDGRTLYVADSGNKAVRAVRLDKQNQVETLCKNLARPTDLLLSADQRQLFIYDRGSRKILALDLGSKVLSTVFTLKAGVDSGVEPLGLLLGAGGSRLLFVDPLESSLMVGDMKSSACFAVQKDSLLAAQGGCLAWSGGGLRYFVPGADHSIYRFMNNDKEVLSSTIDSLTQAQPLSMRVTVQTRVGLQGLTGMGFGQHAGLLAWDPADCDFKLYENPMHDYKHEWPYDPVRLPIKDYLDINRSIGPDQRAYLKGPLSLAYDATRSLLYVSEFDSNRISAIRDDSQAATPSPLRGNHGFPEEKPVGVSRILMLGSSLLFRNMEPEDHGQAIPNQFELYLNFLSSLRGNGKQYEMLYSVEVGSNNGATQAYLLEHPEILDKYHFDYVVLPVNDQSLWWDVNAWTTVETEDDVPLSVRDPEWAAKSIKDRAAGMGPVAQKMVAYCTAEPTACKGLFSTYPGGEPQFSLSCGSSQSFFEVPRLRDLSLEIEKKLALKVAALCRAKGVKPVAVFLPDKGSIAGGERDTACRTFGADLAKEHAAVLEGAGIRSLDLIEPFRALQPQLFPIWVEKHDHYLYRGHQWLGWLMATKFLDEIEGSKSPKALSPMYAKIRLLAGSGEGANRDGNFIQAAFHGPRGLAISADGRALYVADSGNGAIRQIWLDQQNRVETLCRDLINPTDLSLSQDQAQLYIYDRGSRKILQLDLKNKTLSTLFEMKGAPDKGAETLGLLLSPSQGRLCLVDPVDGALLIGDLKSKRLMTAFKDPIFRDAGVRISFSGGRLRCYSPLRTSLFMFMAEGKELDGAAIDAWKEGTPISMSHKFEMAAGLMGLTGMGGPSFAGLLSWDPKEGDLKLFDNSNGNYRPARLALLDYLSTDRSVGPDQRNYFKGPVALAYDLDRWIVYVSQADSNQISAVRDDTRGQAQINPLRSNHNFSEKKPVGVSRILMFGNSLMYGSSDSVPVGGYIPSQIEHYLNLESSIRGTGRQYEMLYSIASGLRNSGGEVTLLEQPELLKKYSIDYVVFPVNEQSLWWDVNAWAVVETKDDVPLRSLDPEWAAQDIQEKAAAMGPQVKKMVAYCKENPEACKQLISYLPSGEAEFHFGCGSALSFFEDPHLRGLALDLEKKLAVKVAELCRAGGTRPVACLIPDKGYLGGGARDSICKTYSGDIARDYLAALNEKGITGLNLVDSFRAVVPQVLPLWVDRGDFHFLSRGQQWVGYLAAMKFLDEVNPPAPAVISPEPKRGKASE